MSRRIRRRATLGLSVGAVTALAVAAMASVGAAVLPSGGPASASQYEKKVTICHRTGSKKNPYRTIRVSRNAVKAHLRHGDAVGPCSTAVFTMCQKVKGGKRATVKVKGARKAQRLLRAGAKPGKCKTQNKRGKPGKDKQKGKDK